MPTFINAHKVESVTCKISGAKRGLVDLPSALSLGMIDKGTNVVSIRIVGRLLPFKDEGTVSQ